MKKIVVIALVSLFVLAIASSCKTADCPAYSKNSAKENTDLPS